LILPPLFFYGSPGFGVKRVGVDHGDYGRAKKINGDKLSPKSLHISIKGK
jgi:hypothetical protein